MDRMRHLRTQFTQEEVQQIWEFANFFEDLMARSQRGMLQCRGLDNCQCKWHRCRRILLLLDGMQEKVRAAGACGDQAGIGTCVCLLIKGHEGLHNDFGGWENGEWEDDLWCADALKLFIPISDARDKFGYKIAEKCPVCNEPSHPELGDCR